MVEGNVPGIPFRRRMSIIKRADGTLIFFNAIPLEEAEVSQRQGRVLATDRRLGDDSETRASRSVPRRRGSDLGSRGPEIRRRDSLAQNVAQFTHVEQVGLPPAWLLSALPDPETTGLVSEQMMSVVFVNELVFT